MSLFWGCSHLHPHCTLHLCLLPSLLGFLPFLPLFPVFNKHDSCQPGWPCHQPKASCNSQQ